MNDLGATLGVVIQVAALATGLVTALWAYTKFVLERGILPPAQLDVGTAVSEDFSGWRLLELGINLRNLGSSTLVASNIRADIRYLELDDSIDVFGASAADARVGRVVFPHSVRRQVHAEAADPSAPQRNKSRGFLLLDYDTFVQAKVNQTYTFVTRIPDTARFLLIFVSFHYAHRPRRVLRLILALSRLLGLTQFTLDHVREPHTFERLVDVNLAIMGRPGSRSHDDRGGEDGGSAQPDPR